MTEVCIVLLYASFAVGIFFRPSIAFAAVITMFIVEQWAISGSYFFSRNQSLINVVVGLLAVQALGLSLFKGKAKLNLQPKIAWAIYGLFGLSLVSGFWTISPAVWFGWWSQQWPYIIVVIVISPLLISNLKEIKFNLLLILLISALFMLLLLTTREWSVRGIMYPYKIRGAVLSSVDASTPLSISSLAGWAVLIAMLIDLPFKRIVNIFIRTMLVVLGLAFVLKTSTRGQLLAAIFCLIVFMPFAIDIRKAKAVVAYLFSMIFVGIILNLLFAAFTNTLRWQSNNLVDGLYARVYPVVEVTSAWLSSDNPMHLFVGMGNSASYHPDIYGFYPHFVAIEVLVEEGVLGFTLFCIAIFTAYYSAAKLWYQYMNDSYVRRIIVTLAALVTFDLLISCKQGNLMVTHTLFVFVILTAKAVKMTNQNNWHLR